MFEQDVLRGYSVDLAAFLALPPSGVCRQIDACHILELAVHRPERSGIRMTDAKARSRARLRASLPRVLVIEGNPGYRSVISNVVEMAGAQWESVAELHQARRQLSGSKRFDMVILGISAGSPVSPEEVASLRMDGQAALIILAESYDNAEEKLEVYQAGADQVLPKPFVPDVLIGAIRAELRRPGPVSVVSVATRIEFAGIVFEAQTRRVSSKEAAVSLTKREWQLFSFLLASPNQFFSAEEIALQAWGPEASVEQFRSYVTRLRQKLSPFVNRCELVTEKGKGYCLAISEPATEGS
jgi:DNA-binding response OmpR family regulator